MSDPAKTPEEIEDVLASIRRLVSDNSPDPAVDPKEIPAAVGEDRLVLTPSFRVTDPEDPWVPVIATELDADVLKSDDAGWQPDDRLVHFDAVGDDTAEQPPEPSEADLADLLHLDGVGSEPAEFEPETGDDNWPGSGAEAALLTLVARRDPAGSSEEVKEMLAEDFAEDDPEVMTAVHELMTQDDAVSEDAVSIGADAEVDTSEADVMAEIADADDAQSKEEAQAFEDAAFDDGADDATELADDLEEDASSEDDVVTDEVVADDMAGDDVSDDAENASEEVSEDADPAADPTHEEPVPIPVFSGRAIRDDAVEDLGEETPPFSFPEAEDGILDEETLREIIVDVVREELQGVLGQRITRNVRKMVRREVRLALAAEDLE